MRFTTFSTFFTFSKPKKVGNEKVVKRTLPYQKKTPHRSLLAFELGVFRQIVEAFAGNSHREDAAVHEGPQEARTALLASVAHRRRVQDPPPSRPDKIEALGRSR